MRRPTLTRAELRRQIVALGGRGGSAVPGANGTNGADGVGVPVGGTTGQVLAKTSNADYATGWVDPSGEGGGVTLGTASVAFTNGDSAQRVTVTDAAVTATSKILTSVTRPDVTEGDDPGLVFVATVVRRVTGSFDAVVVALDLGGGDPTPVPSVTVTLTYTVTA